MKVSVCHLMKHIKRDQSIGYLFEPIHSRRCFTSCVYIIFLQIRPSLHKHLLWIWAGGVLINLNAGYTMQGLTCSNAWSPWYSEGSENWGFYAAHYRASIQVAFIRRLTHPYSRPGRLYKFYHHDYCYQNIMISDYIRLCNNLEKNNIFMI